jgi:hypothetical protein
MAQIIGRTKRAQGRALFDKKTPAHIGIGILAGLLGIEPAVGVLAALTYETAKYAMAEGAHDALFRARPGEAMGNQIFDVVAITTGVYTGAFLRALYRERAQPRTPVPEPAPIPPSAEVAGYYTLV